ncbi:hypothetical protein F5884DRAFT_839342 [Xylogone sp. PMI_703]|nr:hypothetical protein F5884DRAFT_839342 [Xylogone sp. PMI_703]
MCKSPLHPFLESLPKCEQHLHIEGTVSPDLLFSLADTHGITLPTDDPAFQNTSALSARYENFTSLDDFLHYYYIALSVLLKASDFETLAYEYFSRAHADGVHHAEIFFDPQAHTSRGIAYSTVTEGLSAARTRAEKDFGMTTKLTMCFLRNLPVPDADGIYREAHSLGHFSDGTLVGIGMDSTEIGYLPEMFKHLYLDAAEKGIRRTAHAGEEGDVSYIAGALDHCQVERIDHGIRAMEDEAMIKRLASQKTLLTMCPLSNVKLRCVETISDLPIRKFLDEGVRFSINSDDPAYFGGYILDNYCAVQEAFDLTIQEWKTIADGSIEASWCDEERKKVLLGKVEACVERFLLPN